MHFNADLLFIRFILLGFYFIKNISDNVNKSYAIWEEAQSDNSTLVKISKIKTRSIQTEIFH